jgi:hypothetical protein
MVENDPMKMIVPMSKATISKPHPKVEFGELQYFHTFVLLFKVMLRLTTDRCAGTHRFFYAQAIGKLILLIVKIFRKKS